MKLIMTKGLPGSGKTTWAKIYLEKHPETVLVSKDDLRALMFNSAWTGRREKIILAARDLIIIEALKSGRNVVSHDTNFVPKHEARFRELAKEYGAEFEIQDFTQVPIERCIKQDLLRLESVGEKVIRTMYNDWLRPEPLKIEYDLNLPDAVICDIDGTLALFGNANPYDRDFLQDKQNVNVVKLLNNYSYKAMRIKDFVILVSGRKDKYRAQTEEWLKKYHIHYDFLYMRKTLPEGEKDPKDVLVKKEIYETHIKGKYNVLFVLDDRNQVVDMWRSLGLTCLQVAEGDF